MKKNPIKLETFKRFEGFEAFNLAISSGDMMQLKLSDMVEIGHCKEWIHNGKQMICKISVETK